ncbi:MAG TPA: glucokinase, partial [Candidatus Acidoferrales bacterium]
TNLPGEFDAASLARLLRVPRVVLVNDMESTAHGLDVTAANKIVTLVEGEPVEGGNQALIAAGTGLGEALWTWHNGRRVVITTEGGHADFAARNEQEIEFLRFMQKKYKFVSYERILSGKGIRDLHDFFGPEVKHPVFDNEEDDAPAITASAMSGKCATCMAALDQWVSIYGAEAGNLALKALAVGGVYVAGGIAAKILGVLQRGGFARTFREKSKFEYLLAKIPIRVLLDEEAPLDGAAVRAAMELEA